MLTKSWRYGDNLKISQAILILTTATHNDITNIPFILFFATILKEKMPPRSLWNLQGREPKLTPSKRLVVKEHIFEGVRVNSRTALRGPHARHMIFKMASKSQGIQQLLQAEKKAETMVSDARKRKKIFLSL